jgi:hypothetical protein
MAGSIQPACEKPSTRGKAVHRRRIFSCTSTEEDIIACVAPGHPLAPRSAVRLEELFDQEPVRFKIGCFHREFIERVGRETGRAPPSRPT